VSCMNNGRRFSVASNKPDSCYNHEDAMLLLLLLTRQVGAISDCIRHLGRANTNDELLGWRAHLETELADIESIDRKLCNLLDLDPDRVRILGTIRDAEKKREYLKRHPGRKWV